MMILSIVVSCLHQLTDTYFLLLLIVLKGLIGPAGVPGPAGPKGERVSIYVCTLYTHTVYVQIHV